MAEDFKNKVKAALDVCAPWKNIKICQYYISRISDKTNNCCRQRVALQKPIQRSPKEKKFSMSNLKSYLTKLQIKSKQTHKSTMRKKARDEKEIWKVVK